MSQRDPEQYITVGKYLEPVVAQMAKGMLESAGIECFLLGENANSLLAPAFRARLQVHRRDEPEARALLAEAGDDSSGDWAQAIEEASDDA
ncbi:MAG: DUF2007 domain-containing protein [Acidobacteriota bacterium]|nr:DUF2007 domain-containing protein [Acidobacteriota bacterium]